MTLSRQTRLWVSVVMLLSSYAILVWRLPIESIWHDEGWSIRAIQNPFGTPDDNTPYGYYLIGHFFLKLGTGETPFSFRYTSVLVGWLVVALTLHIGMKWFGFWGGSASGVLMATSPLLWEYAQEVRAYIGVPLIALAMLWGLDRLLKYHPQQSAPRYWWGILLLIQGVGLYTHNLVVPLVVWMNVVVGVVWLWRRDGRRLVIWTGVELVVIALYIPWLITQSPSGTPLNTPPELNLALIKDVWYAYFLPVLGQWQVTDYWLILNVGLVMAFVGGSITWLIKPSVRQGMVISQALLVPFFSTVLMIAAHIDFHPRYYIAGLPAGLFLLVSSSEVITRTKLQRWQPIGFVVIAIGGVMVGQESLREIADNPTYQHDDFESLARYYATLPDDAVILVPFEREPALQNYYADQFDIRAKIVTLDLYTDADAVIEALNELMANRETLQVEFLTWFQLPADVRGMYPCLLTGSSREVGRPQTFYGLATQTYILQAPLTLKPLDATPLYHEISLQQARYTTSPYGTCVETDWTLQKPTSEDLRVALQVLNPRGWAMTQDNQLIRDDATIAQADQVETHLWDVGERGQAYNLIALPDAAPHDDYLFQWVVYHRRQIEGLDVFAADGSPRGKTYRLSETIKTQGRPLGGEYVETQLISDNTQNTFQIPSNLPLRITVLLGNLGDHQAPEEIPVRLVGDDWVLEQTTPYHGTPILSWHEFKLSNGTSGQARLMVNELTVATYTIREVDGIFIEPDYDIPIGGIFPLVGELVGVTIDQATLNAGNLGVTVVWRAENTTEISYTVFVQLVTMPIVPPPLAQSDRTPADGAYPTTGWQTNQYIVDSHELAWNVEQYQGEAYLIIGLYNPTTFERVLTNEGEPFVMVKVPLEIDRVR